MSVSYLIKFDVRPEQRERFLVLLNRVLDAMRHEPMFCEAWHEALPELLHTPRDISVWTGLRADGNLPLRNRT